MHCCTASHRSPHIDRLISRRIHSRSYNFSTPGFSAATGHATQVLWVGSTQLGCAVATRCETVSGLDQSLNTLVVCRYAPPGNVLGQFTANVLPQ
jgi:hypothetical protein